MGETPFFAESESEYVPPVPDAGVPESVAVPLPLSTKEMPLGMLPNSLKLAVGEPVEITMKELDVPVVNVVLLALVIAGGAPTLSVKSCTALVPAPFDAVNDIEKLPPVIGVPPSVPVPSPLSWKLTPVGSEPCSVMLGVGDPVVVTVNENAEFRFAFVLFALVIAGAAPGVMFTHHPPLMLSDPLPPLAIA